MNNIKVNVTINKPIGEVWDCWTKPENITNWNFASDDWECPKAENDLRVDGFFKYNMAARDGSTNFDFEGTYKDIEEHKNIKSVLGDGRKVEVSFKATSDGVLVTETFDAETENPEDMQRQGWQSILNNFKDYCEKDA